MRSERPNHLLQLCCLMYGSDKELTKMGIEKQYIVNAVAFTAHVSPLSGAEIYRHSLRHSKNIDK